MSLRLKALVAIDDRHGLICPGEVFFVGQRHERRGGQLVPVGSFHGALEPYLLAQDYVQHFRAAYICDESEDD